MTEHWDQQRERGTPFMMYLLVKTALLCGRHVVRVVLWPIVGYFLLTSPASVRASRHALARLLRRPVRYADVLRHFYSYAACALDRVLLLCGRNPRLQVSIHQPPELPNTVKRGGCVLLVSHMGSVEVMRSVEVLRTVKVADHDLQVSVLMDLQAGRKFFGLMKRFNPRLDMNIIDAGMRGPQLVLALKAELDAGRVVGIAADRARADERSIEVEFAGGKARVPEGPWLLAAACKVPILLGFCLYQGGNRYAAHFEVFSDRLELPRDTRAAALQAVAQRYAQRLEHYACSAPYNWFNFYEYWPSDMAKP